MHKPRALFGAFEEQNGEDPPPNVERELVATDDVSLGASFNSLIEESASIPSAIKVPKHKKTLDLLPLRLGKVFEMWESMNTVEVVRDSISRGSISSAIAYLQHTRSTCMISYKEFKRIAIKVIYQTISNKDLDLTVKMISNIGEDQVQHLKEIAFNTIQPEIRNVILHFLSSQSTSLSNSQMQAKVFAEELESLFSCPIYSKEYTRITKSRGLHHSSSSKYTVGDIMDITPKVAEERNFIIEDKTNSQDSFESFSSPMNRSNVKSDQLRELISINKPSFTPKEGHQSEESNYSQFTLNSLLKWISNETDYQVRARILLGKLSSQNPAESSKITKEQIANKAKLKYAVSHNNWRDVVAIFKSIKLTGSIDENGEYVDCIGEDRDLMNLVRDLLQDSTFFIRKIITDQLSKSGLVLQKERKSIESFVKGLAKSSKLFAFYHKTESRQKDVQLLSLEKLLPRNSKKLSPMQKKVISYFAEKDLPIPLHAFLDSYSIYLNQKEIEDLFSSIVLSNSADWLRQMLLMRCGAESLFQASLSNAKNLFKVAYVSNAPLSIDIMFNMGRLFMAIPTLIYAPVPLTEILSPQEKPKELWNVERKLIETSVNPFPLLKQALFPSYEPETKLAKQASRDIPSSSGDITLFELIERRTHLSNPSFKTLGSIQTLPFSSSEEYQGMSVHKEEVSILFFLTTGRPFESYFILTESKENAWKLLEQEDLSPQTPVSKSWWDVKIVEEKKLFSRSGLTEEEAKKLLLFVRRVALLHLHENSVVASCFLFCKLLGLSVKRMQVDITSAKLCIEYCKSKSHNCFHLAYVSNKPPPRSLQELLSLNTSRPQMFDSNALIELFLYFPHSKACARLVKGLLENAVSYVAMKNTPKQEEVKWDHPVGNHTFTVSKQIAYQVATDFCEVHKLEPTTVHLKQLARENDWINFLHAAQTQRFPFDKVKHLLSFFTDISLKEHLTAVLASLSGESLQQSEKPRPDNLLRLLMFVIEKNNRNESITLSNDFYKLSPVHLLLCYAIILKKPVLAILANSFSGVSHVQCAAAYLYSACHRVVHFLPLQKGGSETDTKENVSTLEAQNEEMVEIDIESLYLTKKTELVAKKGISLEDLEEVILSLVKQHQFSALTKAFRYFSELDSRFLLYLEFHKAFVQSNFQKAHFKLKRFAESLEDSKLEISTKKSASASPGHSFFLQATSTHDLEMKEASVHYMASNLLDWLLQSSTTSFERFKLLEMLDSLKLNSKYSLLFNTFNLIERTKLSADLTSTPFDVLQKLVSKQLYEEARKFALEHHMSLSGVTESEVGTLIEKYKCGYLWEVEAERKKVWQRIDALFKEQNYDPHKAGHFFYQATSQGNSSSEELILLFGLAHDWLSSEHLRDEEVVSPQFLEQLRNSILLLSVGLPITLLESKNLQEGSLAHKQVTNALIKLISSLQLEKAQRVCSLFQLASIFVDISVTIHKIATLTLVPSDMSPKLKNMLLHKDNQLEISSRNKVTIVQLLTEVMEEFVWSPES